MAEQKKTRVVLEDIVERLQEDPYFTEKVITGDETWIFQDDPETKQQSAEWHTNQYLLTKSSMENFTQKCCAACLNWSQWHFTFPPHEGRRFESTQVDQDASTRYSSNVSGAEFQDGYENLEKRWQPLIDAQGVYSEEYWVTVKSCE